MEKLTEKDYWDHIHESCVLEARGHPLKEALKALITKLFGRRCLRPYADYLLWDIIYKKYMPKTKGAKVLEIGSAPGHHLVRLSQTFGFVPYGIEYSDVGAELNRKLFSLYGIDPENVIHADFLSNEFHREHKGRFDIVLSTGFIEHFTDVEDIIEKHINLLNTGGYLFISVPNLRGINYVLQRIFSKETLSRHNTDIMQKEIFSGVFDKRELTTLFCGYYGTFDLGLFIYRKKYVQSFCKALQLILNMLFFILFRDKGAESNLFSPYLIFIGVKNQ
jgi:2-polyprenyl-3-methyl-5-hydroxy-6-metoxy-1,4-benzoquinol methylase